MASFDYDVVIIGSGFGGSVAALRAAEKGYRVGVMESGKRWNDEDIPKSQWHLPGFLWFPAAELYGIQRVEYLDDVLVLCRRRRRRRIARLRQHAVRPAEAVLRRAASGRASPTGPTSWRRTIDQATRMLGVVRYPYMPTDVDRVMQRGRDRDRPRRDVQQGAGRRLLRQPGRRGRGSVLRRRRARGAPAASRAASATSAAATTPRTS